LRVGGKADFYIEPASEADLAGVLRLCAERAVPFFLLGRGSNLLVRDGGFRGVVISLAAPAFSRVEVAGARLECGAGARLKTVATEARRHGLGGLEFLEGIPGSVGGALRMNAGAMGRCMFDLVEEVRCMDYTGQVRVLTVAEVGARYRSCPFFGSHLALQASLRGERALSAAIQQRMTEFSQRRWATQPPEPSAGCIFKNPPGIPAGKLIDELGLKGARVGGAVVSDVHANFIVNDGAATARDILELIARIQQRAKAARGIDLETEVEIIGEEPP
jgi:UDP-N-acetylenolpyruvoylglucosamine reductase